jgi:membrane protease YdiL (CAAX protease family)
VPILAYARHGVRFDLFVNKGYYETMSGPGEELPSDSPAPHVDESPQWLDDSFFAAGDVDEAQATAASPVFESDEISIEDVRPPGPGLPEAMVWFIGVFAIHIFAGIITLMVLAVREVLRNGDVKRISSPDFLDESIFVLAAGEQAISLVLIALAVGLRWGRNWQQSLNLSSPGWRPLLLIAVLILPLSVIVGEHYRWLQAGWSLLTELIPVLSTFDSMNAVEAMTQLSQQASLPLLIVVIAVGPALSEELIFRGLIGRGLVARWGLLVGIGVTSLMFGLVHGHPVHALAVVGLGAVMHLVYLWTRSFWGPVWLHFLNNTWASIAAKLQEVTESPLVDESQPVGWFPWIAAHAVVLVGLYCLWRWRAVYVRTTDAGTDEVWEPGYATAESPAGPGWRKVAGRAPSSVIAALWVTVAIFAASLFTTAMEVPPPESPPNEAAPDEPVESKLPPASESSENMFERPE